jgi:hypothetical protein
MSRRLAGIRQYSFTDIQSTLNDIYLVCFRCQQLLRWAPCFLCMTCSTLHPIRFLLRNSLIFLLPTQFLSPYFLLAAFVPADQMCPWLDDAIACFHCFDTHVSSSIYIKWVSELDIMWGSVNLSNNLPFPVKWLEVDTSTQMLSYVSLRWLFLPVIKDS